MSDSAQLVIRLVGRLVGSASLIAGCLLTPMVAEAAPPAAAEPPPHSVPSTAHPVRRAARVIIISEDGLRGEAITEQHLPFHEQLWKHGSYSWRARTIRTASTLPSHAAMLSGYDVKQHGLTWNNWRPDRGFIRVPTIFEDVASLGEKTAMFVGKFKLRHIARPGTVQVFERPGYYCKKVADEAAEYLIREKPLLTFIHFSNPDEAGHAEGWNSEKYTHAVAEDDRCLGRILTALDEAGLADDTLIIVSADHGGHNRTHSGALPVDRQIPWIARGPGVRRGYHIRQDISTLDTAATALDALGLTIPESALGRPVSEIYSN